MTFRPLLAALPLSFLVLAACQPAMPDRDADVMDASSSSFAQSSSSSPRTCTSADFVPDAGHGSQWTWNVDAATETVALDRPDLGFRADIPFNPSWGSPELNCALMPFEDWLHAGEEGIQFGFASVFEGGGVTRFNVITAVPARSADEAMEAARNEQERSGLLLPPSAEPAIIEVNGNTVVRHGSSGMCDETYFEVIGKSRNYSARSVCDIDPDGLQAALETLVLY